MTPSNFFLRFSVILLAALPAMPLHTQILAPSEPMMGEVKQVYESTYSLKRRSFQSGGSTFDESYGGRLLTFNEDGQLEREQILRDNSKRDREHDYVYENGRLVSHQLRFFALEQPFEYALQYSEKGQLEEAYQMYEGDIRISTSYELRRRGRWMRETAVFHEPHEPRQIITTYENGRPVELEEREIGDNEALRERKEYAYNEEGFLQSEKIFNGLGELVDSIFHAYAYDDRGNWVARSSYYAGPGQHRHSTRRIIYRDDEPPTDYQGRWVHGSGRIILEIMADGSAVILDLEEEIEVQAEWWILPGDRYEINPKKLYPLGGSSKWSNQRSVEADLTDGLLLVTRGRREFMPFFPLVEEEMSTLNWGRLDHQVWEAANRMTNWRNRSTHKYYPERFASVASQFDDFRMMDATYARAKLDDKYALVHAPTGTMLTEAKYEFIQYRDVGLYEARLGGNYGLLDTSGREVIPADFKRVMFISRKYLLVNTDSTSALYDRQGKEVLPLNCKLHQSASPNRLILSDDRYSTLIDYEGDTIIPFGRYRWIRYLSPDRFLVFDGTWTGMVDSMGQEILPVEWDHLRFGPLGFLIGKRRDQKYVLSDEGRILAGPFDDLWYCEDEENDLHACSSLSWARAVATYRKGEEWGFLNGLGQVQDGGRKADRYFEFSTELVEVPGADLRRPKNGWGSPGDGKIYNLRDRQAFVGYDLRHMGDSPQEWLEALDLSTDIGSWLVNGEQVPTATTIEREGRTAQWTQYLFYPTTDGQTFILSFHCPLRDLLRHGSYFYDFASSIEIR